MGTTRINLMEVSKGTSTNHDGHSLFVSVDNELSKGNKAILSLKNASPMSSSFLNSSFGELVEKYGLEKIKASVLITDFTNSSLDRIKNYLQNLNEYAY